MKGKDSDNQIMILVFIWLVVLGICLMGRSFEQRRREKLRLPSRDVMDNHRDVEGQKVRSSKRWTDLAKIMKARHPVCPDPFGDHKGKVIPSEEVHHIVPIKVNPSLAFEGGNLIPLCRACHKRADNFDKVNPVEQRFMMRQLKESEGMKEFDL